MKYVSVIWKVNGKMSNTSNLCAEKPLVQPKLAIIFYKNALPNFANVL